MTVSGRSDPFGVRATVRRRRPGVMPHLVTPGEPDGLVASVGWWALFSGLRGRRVPA